MYATGALHVRRTFIQRSSTTRILAMVTLLCGISVVIAFVIISARTKVRNKSVTSMAISAPPIQKYVRAGALWPQLRWNLRALGDRLERPGKEQVVLTGTMTRAGTPIPAPAVLNLEAPNRITVTTQSGLQNQVLTFDSTPASWAALTLAERDLVETLFFDNAESFFFGQMKGSATRCLGFRFRLDESNTSYDIYAVANGSTLPSSNVQGTKLFLFNSDTHLLDLVRYQVGRNGNSIRVEVRLGNWQELGGQKVARRIDRFENGTNVMTFSIDNVVFAPAATTTQVK
jgi:hypothetical protein